MKNNVIEKWIPWHPAENLAKKYAIYSILDNENKFEIILEDSNNTNNKIKLQMKYNGIYAYRVSEDSIRIRIINELSQNHGKKFHENWTFFKVENSIYVQYLSHESFGISDTYNFLHFVLITDDLIIDLIDPFEPIIEFLN